jgi:hypothetical protein
MHVAAQWATFLRHFELLICSCTEAGSATLACHAGPCKCLARTLVVRSVTRKLPRNQPIETVVVEQSMMGSRAAFPESRGPSSSANIASSAGTAQAIRSMHGSSPCWGSRSTGKNLRKAFKGTQSNQPDNANFGN